MQRGPKKRKTSPSSLSSPSVSSLLHSHHVLILLLYKCTNCTKSLSASMVVQFALKAVRAQMGSWSISPVIDSQILVPPEHLNTNAKPKFITAVDRCFNARHRSSNPVSARNMLTTAPPKFVQRLITTRAKLVKQRWFSVQDFCVGLADPSVRELSSSGAKL